MNRQTKLFLSLAATLVMAVFLLWIKRAEKSLPQLRAAPSIPGITTEALGKVPDAELLDRIYLECLRRMYAANKGLLAGPQVLSEPACHLWVIAMLEDRLCIEGFRSVLRSDRQPGSAPLSPSLEQLREAYRGLGQDLPAGLILESLETTENEDDVNDPYARLTVSFRQEIGKGTQAIRLRYAKNKISTLFPDNSLSP